MIPHNCYKLIETANNRRAMRQFASKTYTRLANHCRVIIGRTLRSIIRKEVDITRDLLMQIFKKWRI